MLTVADVSREPDFEIGGLTVRPAERKIEKGGRSLTLEPRVMQVLLLLARSHGEVVTRAALFQEIWPGATVGDDSLNRAVAGVRKAVAMSPETLELETIPRTGYVLKVRHADDLPRRRWDRRSLIGLGAAGAAVVAAGTWAWVRTGDAPQSEALVDRATAKAQIDTPAELQQAIALLRRAVELSPHDARANGLLAYLVAQGAVMLGEDGGATLIEASSAMERALAADPAEPNALLAKINLNKASFSWAETEDAMRSILHHSPAAYFTVSEMVFLLQAAGLTEESWALNERALAIAPLAVTPKFRRALKSWIRGDSGRAVTISERLFRLWPQHPWVWNARFLILAFNDRADSAMAMLDDEGSRPSNIDRGRLEQWRPTLHALQDRSPESIAAARAANLAAARQSAGQAAYGAMALCALGDVDAAFKIVDGLLLAKGPIVIESHAGPRNMLVTNSTWRQTQWLFTPPMHGLRNDPRFKALCDGVGLTRYWAIRGVPFDKVRN